MFDYVMSFMDHSICVFGGFLRIAIQKNLFETPVFNNLKKLRISVSPILDTIWLKKSLLKIGLIRLKFSKNTFSFSRVS